MRFKFARVRVTGVDCKQQYRGCCSSGNLSILDAPVLSAMTDGNSCLQVTILAINCLKISMKPINRKWQLNGGLKKA